MSALQLHYKPLVARRTKHSYDTYKAALEWDLVDPIVIHDRSDLKSEAKWRGKVEPYSHQVSNLITFCRRLPVTLLADDVGLGKTVSAGLVVSELMARHRVDRVLIVCPKLLGPQWTEELKSKFDIDAEIAVGSDLLDAVPQDRGAVITTYQSARLYLDRLPVDRFDMLILDEAHKLRNLYGVDRPPAVAKKFRNALEARRFRFVLMLTATPIHNRLWDLYSLVDLLTVARGHKNPFGSEGMFARKFIADGRERARQLKPEAQDEFRSIVYGYMSRVRRADARLYFPDRVVQMHRVDPTTLELELIRTVGKSIEELNRLAQISILQALTSSPQALAAQLRNMASKGTVPQALHHEVESIVKRMPLTAKLRGLETLITQLQVRDASSWRLVVFTGRVETQTTIQNFLEGKGLSVGVINGATAARNQDTLAGFRSSPPRLRVIVSTEAGAEGVNLQVANVLVNFDLPWNPMIVEQRIGRIQRLASEHRSVAIFNVMLRGTFEEYIVGRLMEKLQLAAHAVGDIESLLEASGIDADSEGGFEEQLRKLVVAALAGKDIEKAMRLQMESIQEAKNTLEREEEYMNTLLSGGDLVRCGPQTPDLPSPSRSMTPREFVIAAFEELGADVSVDSRDSYLVLEGGRRELICFDEAVAVLRGATNYDENTAPFRKLVGRLINSATHNVIDLDNDALGRSIQVAKEWALHFAHSVVRVEPGKVLRLFNGSALVRARATVAHDSYERIVEVPCVGDQHRQVVRGQARPLGDRIDDPTEVGVVPEFLSQAARLDPAVSEFCRFYLERRDEEVASAGDDGRRRKKLEEDFTPRLAFSLVGLEGKVHQQIALRVEYIVDEQSPRYSDLVTVVPHLGAIYDAPLMGRCMQTSKEVPRSCLGRCAVSGSEVLEHLLVRSEISERTALPSNTVRCAATGKLALVDELEKSDLTGKSFVPGILKVSVLNGKRAEPELFGRCEFTGVDALREELPVSEVSGKRFRQDQEAVCSITGKRGHQREFINCFESKKPILPSEAERCASTGNYVRRGLLHACSVSQSRVLERELERCPVSHGYALRKYFVQSSISGTRAIEATMISSSTGKFCLPDEARECAWSSMPCHPDDLRTCGLSGLQTHFRYIGQHGYLHALFEVLDGTDHSQDGQKYVEMIVGLLLAEGGKCRIEAARMSPGGAKLAVCCEVRKLLGLRTSLFGFVFDVNRLQMVGRRCSGRRIKGRWSADEG